MTDMNIYVEEKITQSVASENKWNNVFLSQTIGYVSFSACASILGLLVQNGTDKSFCRTVNINSSSIKAGGIILY